MQILRSMNNNIYFNFLLFLSETIEQEAELKHQYDMKHLQAELKGKAQVERENRDIYAEQIKLRASENRQTVLESITLDTFTKWI